MKRLLAAACAAVLLTGSLTACSSRTTRNATNGVTGTGTGTNPTGTTYSAPGQVRYPAGAAEDRTSYNRMTNTQSQYDGASDGRYTAYSDGTVSPGHGAIARDNNTTNNTTTGSGTGSLTGNVARGAGDLVNGAGNAVADIGTGIGNAARDITTY